MRVGTAVLLLPEEHRPELSASFLVRARAITLEGEERAAAMSFLYSRPHAQPTGRFTDREPYEFEPGSDRWRREDGAWRIFTKVFHRFGIEFTDAAREQMTALHGESTSGAARPVHKYSLDDFGLTPEAVNATVVPWPQMPEALLAGAFRPIAVR